jgi:hydrogenase expression/formation protein HypC
MCLGVPAKVIRVDSSTGRGVVEVGGIERAVDLGLLEPSCIPGEWVITHMGFALERLSEFEALEVLSLLSELQPVAGIEDSDVAL